MEPVNGVVDRKRQFAEEWFDSFFGVVVTSFGIVVTVLAFIVGSLFVFDRRRVGHGG